MRGANIMKIAKSLFAVILCFVLVISLCACTGSSDTTGNTTASTAQNDKNVTATGDNNINTSGETGENPAVGKSYFDNVAFVGDSVSLKLSYYASATGDLGNAQFFTAGSLGCGNALWEVSDESVHPSYQGEKMLIEDCIAKSGVSKVYIMLGMNDIGLYGIDDTIGNYKALVARIFDKAPNVKIYVQSMTPMTSTSKIIGDTLNNPNIKVYNGLLSRMCAENGWTFLDVASVMYDEAGENLNRDYCSDPDGLGVHFTEEGCKAWIEYLSTHTD